MIGVTCNNYITATTWNDPTEVFGLTGNSLTVQSLGSGYFTTSSSDCPITSYSKSVKKGDSSRLSLDTSTGALSVVAYTSAYEVTITACARGLTSGDDCVMTSTINLAVYEYCKSYLQFT